MTSPDAEEIHTAVRERYAAAAQAAQTSSSCAPATASTTLFGSGRYESADTKQLPRGAITASLGCGNPTMLAELHPGDVVLDLGSGGGIDVLLSARRVGPHGKAYGLDMTPEMLDLARRNQTEAGIANAEFLLGRIEDVPLPSDTVDVIISNCVVNLSPDKGAVLREGFRVLRPGGRLALSDIVLTRPLPDPVRHLIGVWTGCIAGALVDTDYESKLHDAGFIDVDIETTHVYSRTDLASLAADLADTTDLPADQDLDGLLDALEGTVMSAFVRARTPD